MFSVCAVNIYQLNFGRTGNKNLGIKATYLGKFKV